MTLTGQEEGGVGPAAAGIQEYGVAVDGGGGGGTAEEQTDQKEPSVSSECHLEGKEHEAGERDYDGVLRVLPF